MFDAMQSECVAFLLRVVLHAMGNLGAVPAHEALEDLSAQYFIPEAAPAPRWCELQEGTTMRDTERVVHQLTCQVPRCFAKNRTSHRLLREVDLGILGMSRTILSLATSLGGRVSSVRLRHRHPSG